jgi:hypothetical protein
LESIKRELRYIKESRKIFNVSLTSSQRLPGFRTPDTN